MNINQRDKKILIAGIVFVVCYMLVFYVAEPIYKKQAKTDDKIKIKVQFIQKYYEVLNQKSYYQEKEKANQSTHVSLTRKFFKEKQPGLAAASLQKLVESFSSGTVAIDRTKVNKPKYIEGMLAVPIEISVRSNLKNLSLFLMRIENHEKFLIIEELRLRRINKTDPEDLQTRLMITGFIQELEPQDGKPI
jgi:Tfp pilus assembly protein PilO